MFALLNTIHNTVTSLAATQRLRERDLTDIVLIDELEVAVPEAVARLLNPTIVKVLRDGRELYRDMKKAGVA